MNARRSSARTILRTSTKYTGKLGTFNAACPFLPHSTSLVHEIRLNAAAEPLPSSASWHFQPRCFVVAFTQLGRRSAKLETDRAKDRGKISGTLLEGLPWTRSLGVSNTR